MAKRKFIQMTEPPYDLIEVSYDYEPPSRGVADSALWNDRSYDGLRATDGTPINSRVKQREYMHKHGLTTVDDFKQEWKQQQKRRDDYRTGQSGTGAVKRGDVARAIHQLESRRK